MAFTRAELQRLVELEAAAQGVDPAMALAVAQQESDFDPAARSPKGAVGVMQLMPGTAKQLRVDPSNPADNIRGGVTYLAQLSQRYGGDRAKTLAAYNAGMGIVDQYRGVPPFKETRSYVSTILGMLGAASAEAAAPTRLQELEAELARRAQVAAPSAGRPAPPTARSTPEQAAAYRAWATQQNTGGPPSPATTEPPTDLVIDIEKDSPPATLQAAIQDIEPLDETAASRMLAARSPVPSAKAQGRALGALGISALGSTGGAAVGGALGGVPGAAIGEMAGSYGARKLNVALGLEEPGMLGDVASAVVPGALRGAGALVKRALPTMPGAPPVMHEMAQEGLEQLPARLAPASASAPLYQAANAVNPPIPAVSLWKQAGKVLKTESGFGTKTVHAEAKGVAQELLDLAKQHGGQVPLQDLDRYRQRVNLMAREASTAGNRQARQLQQLHSAIMDDLERAGRQGIPGGKELVQAIRADRKEHAVEALKDLWSSGKGVQFEGGDIVHIYGKRIQNDFLKKLESDPHFAKSFTPAEVADIKKTLAEVARLTRRTPTSESGWVDRAIRTVGAAAGVGTAYSGDLLGGAALALGAQAVPDLLAAAMQSHLGRAALRTALQEGHGRLTNAGLRGIAAAIAAEQLPAAPGPVAPSGGQMP